MHPSETNVPQHTARPETSKEKEEDSDFGGGRERVLLFCCIKRTSGRYLIDLLSSITDSQGFWAQFFNIQMTPKKYFPSWKAEGEETFEALQVI